VVRPGIGLAVFVAGLGILLSVHLLSEGEQKSLGRPEFGSYRVERHPPAERRRPSHSSQRHEQRERSVRHNGGSRVERQQGSGGDSTTSQVSEAPRDVAPTYAPPEPATSSYAGHGSAGSGGGAASEFGFEG
jgi:hypothetical protein